MSPTAPVDTVKIKLGKVMKCTRRKIGKLIEVRDGKRKAGVRAGEGGPPPFERKGIARRQNIVEDIKSRLRSYVLSGDIFYCRQSAMLPTKRFLSCLASATPAFISGSFRQRFFIR